MKNPTIMSRDTNDEQIPVIDLSHLNHGLNEDDTERAYAELRRACEKWGFFVVKNHGIKEDIIHQMDSVARQTFSLPKETKQKYNAGPWNVSYLADLPGLPFYESICVDPTATEIFSEHLWPQGNPETWWIRFCSKIIEDYANAVEEVTNDIIKAILVRFITLISFTFFEPVTILRNFKANKYYSSFQFVGKIRMNYCNAPPKGKGGCTTHTGQNCIVVMYQDKIAGLEIKSKAGNWVDVKPVENSLVVFMGDYLKAWSNGRIRNVIHRVVCEGYPRVSVPFFYYFSDNTLIHAPPEFVDNDHPRLYKPFVYADYAEYWKPKKKLRVMSPQCFLADTQEAFLEEFAGI